MSKRSYSELLQPLWQKKRLEVLQQHEFTCECCDSEEKTLHVHHGYYEKDRMPWEYPLDSLHCLCEDCHRYAEIQRGELLRLIGMLPVGELKFLKGYVSTRLMLEEIPHWITCDSDPSDPKGNRVLEGLATGVDGHPDDFLQEVRDGVIMFNLLTTWGTPWLCCFPSSATRHDLDHD